MSVVEASDVFLHVYDLTSINKCLKCCCIGLYHTGVQVYNQEFMYCASVGVTTCIPKKAYGCEFIKQVFLGTTELTRVGVYELTAKLSLSTFGSKNYHITKNNCNTFSKTFSDLLLESQKNIRKRRIFSLPRSLSLKKGKGSINKPLLEKEKNVEYFKKPNDFPLYLTHVGVMFRILSCMIPNKYLRVNAIEINVSPTKEEANIGVFKESNVYTKNKKEKEEKNWEKEKLLD